MRGRMRRRGQRMRRVSNRARKRQTARRMVRRQRVRLTARTSRCQMRIDNRPSPRPKRKHKQKQKQNLNHTLNLENEATKTNPTPTVLRAGNRNPARPNGTSTCRWERTTRPSDGATAKWPRSTRMRCGRCFDCRARATTIPRPSRRRTGMRWHRRLGRPNEQDRPWRLWRRCDPSTSIYLFLKPGVRHME